MKPSLAAFAPRPLQALAAACLLCLAARSQADVIYWDGVSGNSWSTAASWSTDPGVATPDPLAVPGASDTARFNITGANSAQTVNLGADQAAAGLVFANTGTTALQGGGTNRVLALGAGGITVNSGAGAVTIGSGSAGQNVAITLAASQTWANVISSATTINNNVTGSGADLIISGNLTFRAGAVLNLGTNTLTYGGGGTLDLQNNANTIGNVFLNGGTTFGRNAAALGTTGNITLGATGGSTGATLSLATATYTKAIALGTTTGTLSLGNYGFQSPTINSNITGTNNLSINGTVSTTPGNSGYTITLGGSINPTGNLNISNTGTGEDVSVVDVGTITVSGVIGANVGNVTVNNSTTGTTGLQKVAFSSGSNAYTGTTTVNANARLQLGASNVIPDGAGKGNVSLTGTLDLNQYSDTVNGLSGTGTVDKSSATNTSTLTVGGNNASSTFGGIIKNTAGTVALTKTGTGTLTLSATNTYSGTTTINSDGGKLLITNPAALGSGTTVAIPKGGVTSGTLQLQLTGTNTLTKNFTFSSANSQLAGTNTGSAHIQNISGNNTLSGSLLLNGTGGNGINIQSDAGLLTLSGSISSSISNDNTRQLIIGGAGDGAVTGVVSNTGANVFTIIKGGTGTWTFSGASTNSGTTSFTNGTILIGVSNVGTTSGALGTGAVSMGAAANGANLLTNGAFTFSNAINVAATPSSGTNIIGGNTDSTSTFSGAIGLAGDATISQVATTGGNALNITGGIKATNTVTSTATFAGPGAINVTTTGIANGTTGATAVKVTGGTVTYSVANTYTGGTSVTGGTLSLSADSLLADGGAVEVSTGATLNLNFTGTDQITKLTFDGVEQATGTWGAPGSGADHTDARLTGTGKLLVLPFIYQWTNGGGDALWSTALNWDVNLVPSTGTQLYFPNAAAGTLTNDLPPGITVDRMRFLAGSNVYTLLGTTPLGLSGGIDNLSSGFQLIGFPIQLGTNPSIGSGTGGLGLYGNLTGVSFTKTDAGVLELMGTNSYTGTTTIANGSLKISGAGALPATTVVAFTNTTTTASLDLTSIAQTVAGLTFGTQTSGTNTVTITGNSLTTSPATLAFSPLNSANNLTVDMSTLGAFTYNNATGTLKVDGGTAVGGGNGHFSTLSLSAESNTITAANLSVGNAGASGGVPVSTLNLGRNNTLNTGTISIASSLSRASGVMQFGPAVTGAKSMVIRGATGGSSTANMNVAAGNSFQVSDVDNGTFDVSAGTLDALFGTVTLARASTNANTRGTTVNGTFKMGVGTMSANSVILGTVDGTGTGSTEIATALLDIGGGGTANISNLTFATSSLAAGNTVTVNSQVNIGGGATLNAATIQRGTVTDIGTLTTRINWNDGTIGNLTGGNLTVGGVSLVLGATGSHTFSIAFGQTGSVSSVISGTGSLTKAGPGNLTLSAVNTYTGDTYVNDGTFALTNACFADTSTVAVLTGGKVGLNFSGSDVVAALFIDGLQMPANGTTYGATGSGASVIDDTHFSGTGRIQVGVAADPFNPWIDSFTSLTNPADKTKSADPDHDGRSNLMEFALDGDPTSSANDGKIRSAVGLDNVLTITLPVRLGASFTAGGDLVSAPVDGVIYKIQGSTDLSDFVTTNVTEVIPALTSGMPNLTTGWEYRTFRLPGTTSSNPRGFLRAVISEP